MKKASAIFILMGVLFVQERAFGEARDSMAALTEINRPMESEPRGKDSIDD